MIITERQTMHGHEILIKEQRHTARPNEVTKYSWGKSGYPVVTIKCITYVTGQYLKNLDSDRQEGGNAIELSGTILARFPIKPPGGVLSWTY